jgi:iron(II)-dependent oxidoreductase
LPSEAEWHRAFEHAAAPQAEHDNFDFFAWNPTPVSGQNGDLGQLVGNGWEWTSSPFGGFPGFKPFLHYPGYSADFFDGVHFVLKGASPVTPAALVRRSFRNWFQGQYRYAYTAFRCARDL